MSLFGQTENDKYQLTQELLRLEGAVDTTPPSVIVQEIQNLISRVQELPRWQDSRSGLSASFQTLVRDQEFQAYLTSTDILARARALLTLVATRLTPAEAEAAHVGALQRTSSSAAEEHLEITQRLSQPSGSAWEIARETPDPFIDEAVRRGGQVKEVGSNLLDKTAPIAQQGINRLDEKNLTNPILVVVSLGMLVFMKNKLLAILLIAGMVYLTKQRQISELKESATIFANKVEDRVSSITG